MSYFTAIAGGLKSLVTGLGITARQIGRRPVTLTYPHVKPELSEAYRSLISLVQFEELGTHDCVACMQCVKICPSFCIEIDGGKVEGIKRKRASKFEVDFALCSLCGLCIDVCPTDTLEYSKLYDEAGFEREWVFDLLGPFRDFEDEFVERQRESDAREAAEKAAKKAAAAKAKAAKETAEAASATAPKSADGSLESAAADPGVSAEKAEEAAAEEKPESDQ